jgi:hypothetical protein
MDQIDLYWEQESQHFRDTVDANLHRAYWVMRYKGDRDEHGRSACEDVLRAIAENKITGHESPFPNHAPVLHCAIAYCSASIVRRLVVDLNVPASTRGANGKLPMHVAATCCIEPLEKCMLLPTADLAKGMCDAGYWANYTPLELVLHNLLFPNENYNVRLQVLQWMLQQAECLLDIRAFISQFVANRPVLDTMMKDAVAARKQLGYAM